MRAELSATTPQGTAVGSLVIEEKIASTGSGDVLLARQPGLGRRVLVRTLRRDLLGSSTLVERFRREARMAARICHPGVQQVFDLFAWHGDHYLVLEHVEGDSLRAWIDRLGTPPPAVGRAIALELARAVEALHGASIVHADLRADSVRLGRWGEVKLGNLGWARNASETGVPGPDPSPASAPEIAKGTAPDLRSDVFSLGLLIAELLTGKPRAPRGSGGVARLLRRALHADPARRPDVSTLIAGLERQLGAARAAESRPAIAAWLLQRNERMDPPATSAPVRHPLWRSPAARVAALAGAAAGLTAALLAGWERGALPGARAVGPLRVSPSLAEPPSVDAGSATGAMSLAPARLRFAVFPWGEVRVDGGNPIVTPRAAPLDLAPGTHQVEIVHPTLGREVREVTLAAGEQRTLRHVFDRTPLE
jgi:serine/threonine-protein kinase